MLQLSEETKSIPNGELEIVQLSTITLDEHPNSIDGNELDKLRLFNTTLLQFASIICPGSPVTVMSSKLL